MSLNGETGGLYAPHFYVQTDYLNELCNSTHKHLGKACTFIVPQIRVPKVTKYPHDIGYSVRYKINVLRLPLTAL